MSTDLIFASLSRQGKTAVKKDDYKIADITKDRKLKPLNDEEKSEGADDWKVNPKADPNDLTDDQGLDDREDDDDHLDVFV